MGLTGDNAEPNPCLLKRIERKPNPGEGPNHFVVMEVVVLAIGGDHFVDPTYPIRPVSQVNQQRSSDSD